MRGVEERPAGVPAIPAALDARAIVLVEGISDQAALEALAARLGRDLEAERVRIVPIGGAQAIARILAELASTQPHTKLAGLCDSGEEVIFRRALERVGFGVVRTREEMEAHGFYVCVNDLEEELIRAVGSDGVLALLEHYRELSSFRTMQKQPAWRGRPVEAQLRRFMGSSSFGKLTYAQLLVDALDLARVPHPLDGVLAYV